MSKEPKPELLKGERILWEGRPVAGLMFRPIDYLLVPFSLFWGGFAAFWNINVWSSGAPLIFRLWGLPFLVIGLYIVVGRFWVDARARRMLRYYITNRRILISRRKGSSITSLDINRLPTVNLEERSDGSGTIKFGDSGSLLRAANGFGIWQPSWDTEPQFMRTPDIRAVYEIIQTQANSPDRQS